MCHGNSKADRRSDHRDTDRERAVRLPIDGILDLHAFAPGDVRHLVPDYLDECRRLGIHQVRIIHGKGNGSLRRTVHAILERTASVHAYRIADLDAGSWGATLVELKRAL